MFPSALCVCSLAFSSLPQSASGHQARHTSQSLAEQREACVCVCGLCSRAVRAVYSLAHSSLSSLFLSTCTHTHAHSECHPFPVSQSSSSPNSLLLNYRSPFHSHLTNPSVFPSSVACDLSILLCALLHHLFMSSLSLSLCNTHSRLLTTGVVFVTMVTALIDMV